MNEFLIPLSKYDVTWAARGLPLALRTAIMKLPPGDLVIAGGYLRAKIAGERVNDIDLFVRDRSFAMQYAKQLAGKRKIHETENALSFSVGRHRVQIIQRWVYGHPGELLQSFDFTIAMAGIWYTGSEWTSLAHPNFYSDLAAKRLVYTTPNRNEDAGGSMLRVLKFYQRGYRIPLDSLGAVIARIALGASLGSDDTEQVWGKVLTALLREVDPEIDPNHLAHLPSQSSEEKQ